ncbi:MAG: response regulator [Candidatus Abyssobacteria bacterium SURF_17]|uniref:Response regulator n=1 Tax=Candidatus Abyssobacteria bacterium SURF_17 TaxID=2093361 RepID=A0A419ENE6_9BACT|nr:MAG: response regulator [Candidatus Abyssubacteria bacterium SURF_17]
MKEFSSMPCKRSKKRILIADDNKDFLIVTQSLLEFAGFRAETAKDGEEALVQIKKLKYDLLVLGAVMPRIDGIRLLQMVRKSRRYAEVPVLFVSGYSNKGRLATRVQEKVPKVKGYLPIPFKNEGFLEMVTALLEKKRAVEVQCN